MKRQNERILKTLAQTLGSHTCLSDNKTNRDDTSEHEDDEFPQKTKKRRREDSLDGEIEELMEETPLESDPHSSTAKADLSDGWGLDDIQQEFELEDEMGEEIPEKLANIVNTMKKGKTTEEKN
ncbi:hypothetical protein BaRGS_00021364 [Batillaria attramentaria]|uniref:Uncharacterized protein n=1 Tax=Batillaria attramentaria TaxID=370345 RepID=A0ABD0KK47_9CAEN